LIFSKSDNFGSFIIRWGTSKDFFGLAETSHVALAFEEHVIHSTLERGVHSLSYETFKRDRFIVAEFRPADQLPIEAQAGMFEQIAKTHVGRAYDMAGILYFAYRGILRKFAERPFPKTNAMNVAEMDFCTEVVKHWKDAYWSLKNKTILPGLENFDMVDPQTLLDVCAHDERMVRVK
jgi:hypothetical protein